MCNQVYVLIATNTQDFHADDIWLAADTEVAVNQAFNDTMKEYWDAADEDDKAFYLLFDTFVEAWRTEVNVLPVHPLPKAPGE